ncbi:MAG: AAA family ATPase [Thiofilum sp.]|uniref:ATP-binding protein n=1 Tax=Thiofilum sp. TaxID=2212733 RepID=UPI0025E16CAE|nr:AAA family ATPase [Thiofilum sp.]MBK8452289.1 ATP-binding protein [Thiofilum sp.]
MYRKQLEFLKNWSTSPLRKPLVIRGARQVGKSTLVKLFAEQTQTTLLTVNLERYPQLNSIFASNDPLTILPTLELLPRMPSLDEHSLLFLDEIQAAPNAIPALRYFYEEKNSLPLISAGSLLEFALAQHHFSMPVGRIQYLHMGPMTFSEFLLALDENKLVELLQNYQWGQAIQPIAHQRLLQLLRHYYFVGGMPEAVSAFAQTQSYQAVSQVHNSIIDTYREDFPKYAGSRDLTRMLNVFNFAARHVGTKIKYSNISPKEQSSVLKKDIELLCMARVISKVIHSNSSGLPLQANLDEKVYKLLFLDIGLMNAINGLDARVLQSMNETKLINEGTIAEQFIGQHLQGLLADSPNRELTYWLREGRSANAELDYVITLSGTIIPIEVKAGSSGTLKSLHQFMFEKSTPLAVRFDLLPPSLQTIDTSVAQGTERKAISYPLLSLPLYLVEYLPKIVEQVLT